MSLFSFLGCMINRHSPLRREVEWNGRAYVGACRYCGTPIERHGRRNWRKRKSVRQDGKGAEA
jgi:hypothetical protein